MKSNISQIYEDEILMELADGALPDHVSCEIMETVKDSEADCRTLEDFEASALLMEILRAEMLQLEIKPDVMRARNKIVN